LFSNPAIVNKVKFQQAVENAIGGIIKAPVHSLNSIK